MRRVLIVCFSLIGLAASANCQTLSPAETKKLLAHFHEKLVISPNLEADFQEEKRSHFLNKPLTSTGKVWFQAPNKFRREIKGGAQTVAVSNGRDFWIYFPSRKSVQHFALGKSSPVDAAITAMMTALSLENVENTYQVSASKLESAYQLQLSPRTPAGKRLFQRFVLGISSDLFVQRTEMLKPNGDRIVTSYSNQSRATIAPSTFEFTPPAETSTSTPLGR